MKPVSVVAAAAAVLHVDGGEQCVDNAAWRGGIAVD